MESQLSLTLYYFHQQPTPKIEHWQTHVRTNPGNPTLNFSGSIDLFIKVSTVVLLFFSSKLLKCEFKIHIDA